MTERLPCGSCARRDECCQDTGKYAAIIFADIVAPLVAIGIDVDIVGKVDPVVKSPIRPERDLKCLRKLHPDERLVVHDGVAENGEG